MIEMPFEPAYAGAPPWEIGHPQPAIVELAGTDLIRSPILDVGCGTGENSFELARLGHTVVGVDASPTAIRIAVPKPSSAARQQSSKYGMCTD